MCIVYIMGWTHVYCIHNGEFIFFLFIFNYLFYLNLFIFYALSACMLFLT